MDSWNTHDDDVVGKSGWLYADSFLALTVVFLATVSFIPTVENKVATKVTSSTGQTAATTSQATLTPYGVQFLSSYDLNSLNKSQLSLYTILKLDMNQWLDRYKLSHNTRVIKATIIGGYSPSQKPGDGLAIANAVYTLISSSSPLLFPVKATEIKSQSTSAEGQIQIQLTFGV